MRNLKSYFGLTRIQTRNLAITAGNKTASTNLINYFCRFGNITETDDNFKVPNIIIVITRNVRERWCSGVIQELDELQLESKFYNVSYILDKEANSLGQKSMFTNNHAHLGTLDYAGCVTQLALRDNTYFTDISNLSKKSFWEKVCELDNNWPNLNEWWDEWSSLRNNIHGPPDPKDASQNKRKKLVSIVEYMLNNDKRLDFIRDILDSSQETINYLKETNKWIK